MLCVSSSASSLVWIAQFYQISRNKLWDVSESSFEPSVDVKV
uniref:Uncharacterized protein n=1 Tax=Anguilla anguilla TaxID=7936 RepID=A0A0E9SDM4_ANGAN